MRVVATLTTMPDRYHKLVPTITSLRNQTYKLDEIYLGVPKVSRRLNIPYPPVPSTITDICTVVSCTDFGPITKLLGGLLSEQSPNTVIISFDDDMVYPADIVECLVRRHQEYPNSAVGSSGMLLKYDCPMCAITPNEDTFLYRVPKFSIPNTGRRVDSIYGYPGALYVRKFFPEVNNLEEEFLKYALINNDTLMNDDIIISGYLSLNQVERRIFPNMPVVNFVTDPNTKIRVRTENEISYNLDKFFQRMNRAINTSKSLGMYAITESVDFTETILGVSMMFFFSLLIIILLVLYIILLPMGFLGL